MPYDSSIAPYSLMYYTEKAPRGAFLSSQTIQSEESAVPAGPEQGFLLASCEA